MCLVPAPWHGMSRSIHYSNNIIYITVEEFNIKTRVVGVDISMERTTYAIVDVRGNIIAEGHFETLDYPDVNNYVTSTILM